MPTDDLKLFRPADQSAEAGAERSAEDPAQTVRTKAPVAAVIAVLVVVSVITVGFVVARGGGGDHGAAGFRPSSKQRGETTATGLPAAAPDSRSGLASLPPGVAAPTAGANATTPSSTAVPDTEAVASTSPAAQTAPTVAKPVPSAVTTDAGFGAASANFSVRLSARAVERGAELSWTVTGPMAALAGFDLEWTCCGLLQGSLQLPPGARSHTIGNLVPGTAYQARLVARRTDGSSDPASAQTVAFTTPGTPPTATTVTATTVAPEPVPAPSTTAVTKPTATTLERQVPPRPTAPPRPPRPNPVGELFTGVTTGGPDQEPTTTSADRP